ncbi:protein hinderin isoform X2 [Macrotis lagotis]|uniref:protein hinderin isoform X2 n=1 Tax=Macrotis lagotis TaxID=92651 RepID=UPI003D69D42C
MAPSPAWARPRVRGEGERRGGGAQGSGGIPRLRPFPSTSGGLGSQRAGNGSSPFSSLPRTWSSFSVSFQARRQSRGGATQLQLPGRTSLPPSRLPLPRPWGPVTSGVGAGLQWSRANGKTNLEAGAGPLRRDPGSGGCFKMADVTAVTGSGVEAYWSRDLSDDEHEVLHISGISAAGNSRAKHKSKFSKADVKLKASKTTDTSVTMDPFKGKGDSARKETVHNGGMKSASLKDLCPEDKRRIANLIKELARVSEEKEVTEERLKAEQESFEKKIRQLEEQNQLIIREREALQQQYRECQELLSLYQKYLSEQQEKLTLSLSELDKVKEQQQVSIMGDSPNSQHEEQSAAYRNLTSSQTHQNKNEPKFASQSSASERNLHFRNFSPRIAALQPHQGGLNREQAEARTYSHKSPEAKLMGSIVTESTSLDEMRPKKFSHSLSDHCWVYSHSENEHHVHGNHQARMTRQHPRIHNQESHNDCELSWPPMLHAPVTLEPEEIDDKKQVSIERRNKLLLQKMELEIEKEHLQHLLAQQETKLVLKQQQLHQSRLDYSRLLKSKYDDDLLRMASPSKGYRLHSTSERNCTEKKSVGFQSMVEQDAPWMYQKHDMSRSRRGAMSGTRKDASTSPMKSVDRKDFVTTTTSSFQHDAARYNTTLLDLVHSLSPSSAPRPRPPLSKESCACNHNPVQVDPWASRAYGPYEELEESRILEEIFFI